MARCARASRVPELSGLLSSGNEEQEDGNYDRVAAEKFGFCFGNERFGSEEGGGTPEVRLGTV